MEEDNNDTNDRCYRKEHQNHLCVSKEDATPIGHIVPYKPCCQSFGNSSHCAIGLYIPKMKMIALIPFLKKLFKTNQVKRRIQKF